MPSSFNVVELASTVDMVWEEVGPGAGAAKGHYAPQLVGIWVWGKVTVMVTGKELMVVA